MSKVFTVKDLTEKLKLVKNKDVEVVFKSGKYLLPVKDAIEALKENDAVRHPSLGESANCVVFVLGEIPETAGE